jgi:hypothetical protein
VMIPWISLVLLSLLFLFLVLQIWVFSILILVRFARVLSTLFTFSKNQFCVSLILCIFFFFLLSISLILAHLFMIYLLLIVLGLLVLAFLAVWDVALSCLYEIFLLF